MKGILRSGDSTTRIKKSFRFNEVILCQECQLYPAEIDVILARKYKNFKKAKQKRRKAHQRLKAKKRLQRRRERLQMGTSLIQIPKPVVCSSAEDCYPPAATR